MNLFRNNNLSTFKEARYWKVESNGVKCFLCPHSCLVKQGETGLCRTRKNYNNSLIEETYGYPCAIHIDPVEKKPLYHFLPGSSTLSIATTGCNLRCLNCQNYQISQAVFSKENIPYVNPDTIVSKALSNKCYSISYTYTDPIVYYEYTMDTADIAKQKGVKNIIVSAGYINKKPLREMCKLIDAANIDLKCFDEKIYQELSGIQLKTVLDSLMIIKTENVWLEITNLLVPGYSDNIKDIKRMCHWLVQNGFENTPLYFSRFFPTYKLSNVSPTSMEVLFNAYKTAKETGIKYVYLGNVNDDSYTNTYCHNCNHLLIKRRRYDLENVGMKNTVCNNCNQEIPGCWV